MATRAQTYPAPAASDDRFFMGAAVAMVLVVVAGFSMQAAMGRSSFSAPLLVHVHAVVFMGWMAIYLTQTALATTRRIAPHRRLGWIGAGWIALMLILGLMVTVVMTRRGQVPFFFTPQHFLVADPMTLIGFAALTAAAIGQRDRTGWHRRLHLCGTAMLLGPAFGRLLPLPFLTPLAFEAAFVATLLFPLAGIIADWRRDGRVHPAWGWGIAAMVGTMLLTEAIVYSPLGSALYRGVTTGSPGATIAPLAYPPPPLGPQVTGRTAAN